MYKYNFKCCPTNWCYDVSIIADNMHDAIQGIMLRENVEVEYLVFVNYELVE